MFTGYSIDFKTDSAALDSILNGEGIKHLPRTPAKLSSQFGPAKKTRTTNRTKAARVVPFSRPSAAARLRGVQEKEQYDISKRTSINVGPSPVSYVHRFY